MIRYSLRLGRPSDLPFVVDTWVKKGRQPHERIGTATARVRALLAHYDTTLRIACLPDEDDAILGWAALDCSAAPPKLHYVYVRSTARKQGIARSLLAGVDASALEKPGHE